MSDTTLAFIAIGSGGALALVLIGFILEWMGNHGW